MTREQIEHIRSTWSGHEQGLSRAEHEALCDMALELEEALDLLETCRSCDLIYNYQEAIGFPNDDPHGRDVADVVDEFLKKHRK